MRILHITDNYGFTGGIQSYLDNLSSLFNKNGHSVKIYSPPENGENISSYFSRWISFKYYFEIKKIISRFRPHILHGHSVSMRISPFPFLAASGIPTVMTVHDFNYVCHRKWMIDGRGEACPRGFSLQCLISNCPCSKNGWLYLPYHDLRWLKTALHRMMLKKYVHTFICPSRILGKWMKRSLKLKNIEHIPNFVEHSFSGGPQMLNYNQLMFAGRLSEEKGVDCLIRSMPIILSALPEVSLTIIGDGPQRKNLEQLSRDLNITQNVNFFGAIENRELASYYKEATICVLPSLWMENCPVAALEALASGRPVIGSNIGGIQELIRDGTTGFLFQKNDHMELAEKVLLLMKNKILIDDFSKNSRSFYKENFSEEKHFEKIISLYDSLTRL